MASFLIFLSTSFPSFLSLFCVVVLFSSPRFSFSTLFFSVVFVVVVVVFVVVVLGVCARIQTTSLPPLFKISVLFGSCLEMGVS